MSVCKGQLKYEEFSSEGWQLTGIRVPQKWCHEGEVGSKPKKKPGRGTLCQGFPRGRLKAFRVSDLVSFLCCPLVTYDKTAFAIRDLTEERCWWTCKKLEDFLCLKISLEEGVESREEKEGVSRDHEEEEGGKKARAKLCPAGIWSLGGLVGKGKDKESDKGSDLFPGPRGRSFRSRICFVFLKKWKIKSGPGCRIWDLKVQQWTWIWGAKSSLLQCNLVVFLFGII